MKAKYFLLSCALLTGMSAMAADFSASLAVNPCEDSANRAELLFAIDGSMPFSGFQCDLTLPAGVTPLVDEISNTSRSSLHSLKASQLTDGRVIVTCVSMSRDALRGDAGALFSLPVRIDNISDAGLEVKASYIALSTPEQGKIMVEDTACLFNPTQSGIGKVGAGNIRIASADLSIRISGASPLSRKQVTDTKGRILYDGTDDNIFIGTKGVFLISVDGKEFKIVL